VEAVMTDGDVDVENIQNRAELILGEAKGG
jgi:hypothetical protein